MTPPDKTTPHSEHRGQTTRRRTPWPLWAVGIVGIIIAAFLFINGADDDGNAGSGSTDNDAAVQESNEGSSADQESEPQPSESSGVETAPESTQEGEPQTPDFGAIERGERTEGDPKAIGDVDAPVMMVAYSEFQCPFCGRFARETMPDLEHYVDDGTLRVEWRDMPYLGEESTTAALAGEAAAQQDLFWEFHDAVYADQPEVNSGTITQEWLNDLAEQVGLDVERFQRDMESDEVAAAVEDDLDEGTSIGVTGTPAFLINGQPVMGAQPTDVFEEAIETAAADAS